MSGSQCVFVEADSIDEFEENVANLDGELWLSCTAPLKHSPQTRLGVNGPKGVNAVNQLKRVDGDWLATSTDGVGFIAACRHIEVEPRGGILRIRGGGSAARAIAAEWAVAGGKIIPVTGRRALVSGPWDEAIIIDGEKVDADLSIDLDADAGGGISVELSAKLQVSISYGEDASSDEFAVIMVVAQHLEAWKMFYAPELSNKFPSISEILELL
jgi:hypothetical protein|tara:strand:- start:1754 stop:2395 length:642 start_codon:yes stop_codon:yes gene_type:complete